MWTYGLFWDLLSRLPFPSTLQIPGFINHRGKWSKSQLHIRAWFSLRAILFPLPVMAIEMVHFGGFSFSPTELINPNRSLTVNPANETWGSFSGQILGKFFLTPKKKPRENTAIWFSESGCDTWNCCSRFTKDKAEAGRVRSCKEPVSPWHCWVSNQL